jgi:FtsH-binding integral membrane protein
MANQVDPRTAWGQVGAEGRAGIAYDAGLRAYMLKIYNYMASGVLLTGMVSLLVASNSALFSLFFAPTGSPTILGWAAIFSPLIMVLVMSFGMQRMSASTLRMLFFSYAALMGVSMATIFTRYTDASIAQTFFVTAGAFAALSLWGYTTRRDLSAFGKFLFIGLIGLVLALIANIFIQSGPFQLAINIIGVFIFAGLTAWDTQRLKSLYFQLEGEEFLGKTVVLGALSLYLNFVNLFQFLLSFLGNRE